MTATPARHLRRAVMRKVAAIKRHMYRSGRPNVLMRLMNRLDVLTYRGPWPAPRQGAVLNVVGRSSGRLTSVPVAVADYEDADYLVSMLGPDANWVRNVQAAGGEATLSRQGREMPIALEDVPAEHRAEVLRRYLAVAPGARPHLELGPTASLAEFRRIASRYPVFRIRERQAH